MTEKEVIQLLSDDDIFVAKLPILVVTNNQHMQVAKDVAGLSFSQFIIKLRRYSPDAITSADTVIRYIYEINGKTAHMDVHKGDLKRMSADFMQWDRSIDALIFLLNKAFGKTACFFQSTLFIKLNTLINKQVSENQIKNLINFIKSAGFGKLPTECKAAIYVKNLGGCHWATFLTKYDRIKKKLTIKIYNSSRGYGGEETKTVDELIFMHKILLDTEHFTVNVTLADMFMQSDAVSCGTFAIMFALRLAEAVTTPALRTRLNNGEVKVTLKNNGQNAATPKKSRGLDYNQSCIPKIRRLILKSLWQGEIDEQLFYRKLNCSVTEQVNVQQEIIISDSSGLQVKPPSRKPGKRGKQKIVTSEQQVKSSSTSSSSWQQRKGSSRKRPSTKRSKDKISQMKSPSRKRVKRTPPKGEEVVFVSSGQHMKSPSTQRSKKNPKNNRQNVIFVSSE